MLKMGQERSDLLKVTRVCKTCWHLSAIQIMFNVAALLNVVQVTK
jgi:hypothetical protein